MRIFVSLGSILKTQLFLATVVREYSKKRWVDAHTINDLAMYNYQEV
jgi:hypothetical protein